MGRSLFYEKNGMFLHSLNSLVGLNADLGAFEVSNDSSIVGEVKIPVRFLFGRNNPATSAADYNNIAWAKGSIVNSITNPGSGWVCTTTGTPGVWVATSLTTKGATSIKGTANQVIASASTGAVTLSLPQSIATNSTPTFGGLEILSSTNASTPLNVMSLKYRS